MTEKEALLRLQDLCSRQEKCTHDVIRKLSGWEFSRGKIEKITEKLRSERFIDDERYARAFARDKFRLNQWGKLKISAHLRQKKIGESLIREVLEEIDPVYYRDTVKRLLLKKKKTLKDKNPVVIKSKLVRFGQSKGIEFDMLMAMLNELTD